MTDQPNPRCGGTPGKPKIVDFNMTRVCPGCPDCNLPATPSGASGAYREARSAILMYIGLGYTSDFKRRLTTFEAAIRAESAAEVERLRSTADHWHEMDRLSTNRAEAAEQRLREVEDERDRMRGWLERAIENTQRAIDADDDTWGRTTAGGSAELDLIHEEQADARAFLADASRPAPAATPEREQPRG